MPVTVRRIRSDEADVLRMHRLAALKDTPSAFGSTYERESAYTAEEWIVRARSGAEGPDRATFFGIAGSSIVGLVGGLRSEVDPSVVDLVSMWTSPDTRRAGVGRALVSAVIEWARASGATA